MPRRLVGGRHGVGPRTPGTNTATSTGAVLDATTAAPAEMHYTSLLVQSQAALQAEAAAAPPGSHVRSRSFRAAFLEAYARRIGRRLEEVNAEVRADVEAELEAGADATSDGASITSSALLPVLAARHDAVAAAVDEQFGDLTKGGTRRSYDAFGWTRGVQAADRAELHRAVDRRH